MNKVIEDRQTLVFSVALNGLSPSLIKAGVNLRFAADELVVKSLSYNSLVAVPDTDDIVQIWCNKVADDGIICAFANSTTVNQHHNEHFTISNSFQSGIIEFQFQQTASYTPPIYNNPQSLISAQAGGCHTNGFLTFTIEFVKYAK